MAGLPSGGGKRGSVPFRAIKSADGIVEGAETVTGSYRTPSGTPGGAVHGPRTVPTASGSARANPRHGKGVKGNFQRGIAWSPPFLLNQSASYRTEPNSSHHLDPALYALR